MNWTALVLTIAITMNVLTFAALYRLWLWAKLSAHIGTPFAIMGSTLGLRQALDIAENGQWAFTADVSVPPTFTYSTAHPSIPQVRSK